MVPPIFENPESLPSPLGYSQLVELDAGRLVLIAGQVALDASGNLVGCGDIRAQAHQVFLNLSAALKARDGTFADLVKLNIFVTDIADLPVLREVRDEHFAGLTRSPVSTLVQVQALFRPEFLIEIEAMSWLAPQQRN
ncbi:RidA family protein [Asticcacaulis sp. DXS10W]|uniref:RidA family protein n=1 Tax=Asticcacaulis currens TaxID=2984210 RepID=A0ABT5IDF5_9CAUL|nr:RidA family protein [Asticcacaulis currens]MDC7694219.1 RidA family protein [Asticcacaulis currens]